MSIIEDLSFYEIAKVTRNYPDDKEDISFCRNWLKEIISEPIVLNFIDDKLAVEMYKQFRIALEEKIETLILEETGEKKIPLNSKVKAKISFGEQFDKGETATVVKITRFEENTFGQGWYIYELDNGFSVYGYEIEVF